MPAYCYNHIVPVGYCGSEVESCCFMDLRNAKISSGTELFPLTFSTRLSRNIHMFSMTKPIRKQFPETSWLLAGGTSIFLLLLAYSSVLSSSSPKRLQGPRHRSTPPLQRRHPPRLLPIPLVGGRGRNSEGSSPP